MCESERQSSHGHPCRCNALIDRPARLAGGIILKLAYGYATREHDDPFVRQAEIVLAQFSVATMPGAFLVDIVPWRLSSLQHTRRAHD
jgi:hypothetical protein